MHALKLFFIRLVLWITDTYYGLIDSINKLFEQRAIVKCAQKNHNIARSTRLLFARVHDNRTIKDVVKLDVTEFMKYYYLTDKYRSCASAYRWLKKCTFIEPVVIDLVFIRGGIIYHSTINLGTEQELGSEKYLNNINLKVLPGNSIAELCYDNCETI